VKGKNHPEINIPKAIRADLITLITVMTSACAEAVASTNTTPAILDTFKLWVPTRIIVKAK
jgi:hypothetical protein